MFRTNEIRMVVFDWAGTAIDHGSVAPVAAFVEVFARAGVAVGATEVRGPMGLHKKDHIRVMLSVPDVAERFRRVHGRSWTEADVDELYRQFMPLQLDVMEAHSHLVPGLLECVAELRRLGMKIGATTGYFREAADRVTAAAARQGYTPDCCVCADDVPAGRPAPWMLFRIMQTLGIYPPSTVVKVGDTVPDIEEGLAAGCWSVGVVRSSSEVGCTAAELEALPAEERRLRLSAARSKLLAAGAHAVIDSLAELPALIQGLTARLHVGASAGRSSSS